MSKITATFKNIAKHFCSAKETIFHTLKKPFQKRSVAGLGIGTAFLAHESDEEKFEKKIKHFLMFGCVTIEQAYLLEIITKEFK